MNTIEVSLLVISKLQMFLLFPLLPPKLLLCLSMNMHSLNVLNRYRMVRFLFLLQANVDFQRNTIQPKRCIQFPNHLFELEVYVVGTL